MENLEFIYKVTSNRCRYRLLEKTDLNEVYKILSDKDIIKNLNMKIHNSINDTEKMFDNYFKEFENGNKLPIAIIEKDTDKFIGVFLIKLDLYNEDAFEFTVYIGKDFQNKGIYQEILPDMTKFAFEILQTKNFRGYVMEGNVASSKGLLKSHFSLEKVFEVPGIDRKIESYLMTLEMYKKLLK